MDFQDFLKRQYTQVTVGEFKPGKFEEARTIYEAAVSTYRDGFKGAYLLQEPGTDRGVSVIFWESIDEMEANEHEENYRNILKKMSPLFDRAPTTALYEVVCTIEPNEAEKEE